MNRQFLVDIPPSAPGTFHDGIKHSELWLWDAWTCQVGERQHLFTLALARRNASGEPITPAERNDYPFHIRRFVSDDQGRTWRDCGPYLSPSKAADGALSHNLWSGSAMLLDEKMLFGFTGVRQPAPDRSFVQTVCALRADIDGTAPDPMGAIVISDPEKDYDAIRTKGYYLGPREDIGSNNGEEGGPILAWRDPYFLQRYDGSIDAFWAAKSAPSSPAVAHARLTATPAGFDVDLLAPIVPPDADQFTQAEVPKIYRDPAGEGYLLLLSTCNRLREDQPDSEVSKELRLYRAAKVEGPWRPYRSGGSAIPSVEHLFGGSFATIDPETGQATLIAPYTEMAEPGNQLTFAPPIQIDLKSKNTTAPRAASIA